MKEKLMAGEMTPSEPGRTVAIYECKQMWSKARVQACLRSLLALSERVSGKWHELAPRVCVTPRLTEHNGRGNSQEASPLLFILEISHD